MGSAVALLRADGLKQCKLWKATFGLRWSFTGKAAGNLGKTLGTATASTELQQILYAKKVSTPALRIQKATTG